MDWQKIKISKNRKNFLLDGNFLFPENFLEVLEFQFPGVAAVQNTEGWFHILADGTRLYAQYFDRVFGFYFDRATVQKNGEAFHIGFDGLPVYPERYLWCGNYQENFCVVKNFENQYFHIDLNGNKLYQNQYRYTGDFREGIACVLLENGNYSHIDSRGEFLHGIEFELLDVYHKGFARAKDAIGWFHINRDGKEIYSERYSLIEPFYNGFAFCVSLSGEKLILNEQGKKLYLNNQNLP